MRLGKQQNESKYLAIQYFYKKNKWSIKWMCKQLKISRAAYYKWLHREVPQSERLNIEIATLIKEYDDRFHHILGYRRMTLWINRFNHTNYGEKRIYRIMRVLNLHSVIRKKRKKFKTSTAETIADNILQRNFYATMPNQKWVTDITEFKIPNTVQKIYLSVILDLYDRFPVAFIISNRNNNQLVFKTFEKATVAYPNAKPLFHSDRGFQYTNKIFQDKLKNAGMQQSMSRVGHCIDNCSIEGFWGTLKSEMYQMYDITDERSLRYVIKDYIRFYSEERLQERFHGKTPLEVRQAALNTDMPMQYPIPENKRIEKYKKKWSA